MAKVVMIDVNDTYSGLVVHLDDGTSFETYLNNGPRYKVGDEYLAPGSDEEVETAVNEE